jgi:SAM-dependent methyltransferase
LTTDIFHERRQGNQFDDLRVDVEALYARFPLSERARWGAVPSATAAGRLYALAALPLKGRRALCRLLRRLRLDLSWFQEFRSYWSAILGGRPLWDVEDFHFLRGIYRMRHQANVVPDTDDAAVHVQAWQRPELLYQLFQQVFVESIATQAKLFEHVARCGLARPASLLEYGCATAPVTASFFEFFGRRKTRITIADIPTLAFHYAVYRFGRRGDVTPVLLKPEDGFGLELEQAVDVAFCLQVFEHLPGPLAGAQDLHRALRPGGLLVFDYVKGEGQGLDTLQGVRQRQAVLDFIDSRFDVVSGALRREDSMGLTLARKRA